MFLQASHGADHLSTSLSVASPLDETLDREVLLMMQGPAPEHMAQEFRSLLSKLVTMFGPVSLFLLAKLISDQNSIVSISSDNIVNTSNPCNG